MSKLSYAPIVVAGLGMLATLVLTSEYYISLSVLASMAIGFILLYAMAQLELAVRDWGDWI